MAKVSIIGSGPAGTYAARQLAGKGHDVRIFEDHHECGSPIQCTGILTHVSNSLIDFNPKFIDNKIDSALIFSPKGEFAEVKFHEPNLIVNRTKYDQHLLDKAIDKGTEIKTGNRYLDVKKDKNGKVTKIKVKDVKSNRIKYYKTDYLVGADGPNSTVAKTNNLFGKREFFIGAQARVKIKNEGNRILFYPHIKDFAWAVPENENIMRIGIAARDKASQRFKDFLKRFDGDILEYQGGPIPIHNPLQRTQRNNVFLVGDAATHVKATTGGGIIQAMTAASSLARAIEKNPDNPKYELEWRKAMGMDLMTHNILRRMLDNLKPKEWNKLISTYSRGSLKEILEKEDRDLGYRIALKSVLRRPDLLLYSRKLII